MSQNRALYQIHQEQAFIINKLTKTIDKNELLIEEQKLSLES